MHMYPYYLGFEDPSHVPLSLTNLFGYLAASKRRIYQTSSVGLVSDEHQSADAAEALGQFLIFPRCSARCQNCHQPTFAVLG
jgi:hypothetical protein